MRHLFASLWAWGADNSLSIGKNLAVSLSVLLTVALFYSIGGSPFWGAVYGVVGLVLSIAQFSLPKKVLLFNKTGQDAPFWWCVILLVLLQVVSLAASVGSLSASLDNIRQESEQVAMDRQLLLRQIKQEQDRVDVWNQYDRPSKADEAQAAISTLRAELAALPRVENTNAVALVDDVAQMTGFSEKVAAGSFYIALSVLLDACAVFFILADAKPVRVVVQEHQDHWQEQKEEQEQPQEQPETLFIETPYQAIFEGVCRLSVRGICKHYGIGTEKAYTMLDELQTKGLIAKDDQRNRYVFTEKARVKA